MTDSDNPEASGSGTSIPQSSHVNQPESRSSTLHSSISSSNTLTGLPYGSYSSWNNAWSSNYSGYASMIANPALYAHMAPYPTGYVPQAMPFQTTPKNPYSHLVSKSDSKVDVDKPSVNSSASAPVRVSTPQPPDPESYRYWDEILKKFLQKTRMAQCLRGLEADMLVLNADWEQKVVPEALRELVNGIQVILERISRKATDERQDPSDVKITTDTERPLDERKLDYVRLRDGEQPQSPSTINKSISQFIARSRARNDASNRAEFLHTLAEKKQKLAEEAVANSTDMSPTFDSAGVASCARIDAKTIDREKQMKYDIAKNEAGPLTRAVAKGDSSAILSTSSNATPLTAATASSLTLGTLMPSEDLPPQPRKKRRITNVEDESADYKVQNSSKSKSKAKEEGAPGQDGISTGRIPVIEERLRNIEEHLAVRYVPSPPYTFLARLKYLEDHLIKLEKEYPPWAALHFNQPNRGWPPPPRLTPIIVPPHLRSTSHETTANIRTGEPKSSSAQTTVQPSVTTTKKGRAKASTLHKAVMDRLEIQQAMNEMGNKSRDG